MKCHFFVDFDGTICPLDTSDLLLERFANPLWQNIEDEWKAGRIGSYECMSRQVDLLRAHPAQLDAFTAGIKIDPGFAGFVRRCHALGHQVTVVSDGLDRNVSMVLQRAGLQVPFYANRLEWIGGGRWRLSCPYAKSGCLSAAGNCKCRLAGTRGRTARILIGDGRSDFCFAGRVDLVLAKASLAAHCLSHGLSHITFNDFAELSELLAKRRKKAVSPAAYLGEQQQWTMHSSTRQGPRPRRVKGGI
jgi:2,3-diketo-5-methylthio-1-phosphopentane phosphatase